MKKIITGIAVFLSALILVVFFGCSAFQDAITPCVIEQEVPIYAGVNNVRGIPWLPFDSLLDAERINARMDFKHILNQKGLERLREDDNILYSFLTNTQGVHITGAREFQQKIFSPTGPIGMLIPTFFGGTLGALLIPRPGEKKKIEQAKEEGKKEANNKNG